MRESKKKLKEILSIAHPTLIERDAWIQRFECTFEAVQKLAKQYLRGVEGIYVGSPKSLIRSCREVDVFSDQEQF